MDVRTMTPAQIRHAGLEALVRELGPAGMLLFLQQFELGSGDYTRDRHQWLDQIDVKTLAEKIRQEQKEQ